MRYCSVCVANMEEMMDQEGNEDSSILHPLPKVTPFPFILAISLKTWTKQNLASLCFVTLNYTYGNVHNAAQRSDRKLLDTRNYCSG